MVPPDCVRIVPLFKVIVDVEVIIPPETVIVPELVIPVSDAEPSEMLKVPLEAIVINPERVNLFVDTLIVKVPNPLTVPIVMVAQAAVDISTVTLYPRSIVTASDAAGILAPDAPPDVADQVLVAFQFPVATENRFAA